MCKMNLLVAIHGDADGQIRHLDPHSPFAHLHLDAAQVDDGVDRIERPGLPGLDLFTDCVGHG
jgi:hypothetical protein